MADVQLSKAAHQDLLLIHRYISKELSNPDAALKTLQTIQAKLKNLEQFPESGKPLDSVLDIHTEYRFLICGHYKAFYLFDGQTVSVIRILHSLQDYMRVLFDQSV